MENVSVTSHHEEEYKYIPGQFGVDLGSIFGRFLWILGLGKYVIGLAKLSEAGLRSNEVLFFGFFPFAIIFFGAGSIFESSRHGPER